MTTKAPFNPASELQAIKDLRGKKRKRRTWGRSKLQPYLGELLSLQEAGATFADLVQWLANKRIQAHKSTVQRFLRKAKQGTVHG